MSNDETVISFNKVIEDMTNVLQEAFKGLDMSQGFSALDKGPANPCMVIGTTSASSTVATTSGMNSKEWFPDYANMTLADYANMTLTKPVVKKKYDVKIPPATIKAKIKKVSNLSELHGNTFVPPTPITLPIIKIKKDFSLHIVQKSIPVTFCGLHKDKIVDGFVELSEQDAATATVHFLDMFCKTCQDVVSLAKSMSFKE